MKNLLELKNKIIYGPVNSRRLGKSLGINVIPAGRKICSFDCQYCQYGWTQIHIRTAQNNPSFPEAESISSALEEFLMKQEKPEYITLSGNGEATVHPQFGLIVSEIIRLRDKNAPSAKTAILSNSSTVDDQRVRLSLSLLDDLIMKLDCVVPEIFSEFNGPCDGVNIEAIIEGLKKLSLLKPIIIQSLFASGNKGNYSDEYISKWIGVLKYIKPYKVQAYTLHRGYPSDGLIPLTVEELSGIKNKAKGIFVEIY